MSSRVRDWISAHGKLILITFEVFWIIVFVLERVSRTNSVDIPQFIYVNF